MGNENMKESKAEFLARKPSDYLGASSTNGLYENVSNINERHIEIQTHNDTYEYYAEFFKLPKNSSDESNDEQTGQNFIRLQLTTYYVIESNEIHFALNALNQHGEQVTSCELVYPGKNHTER